jgi:hypothetical protein
MNSNEFQFVCLCPAFLLALTHCTTAVSNCRSTCLVACLCCLLSRASSVRSSHYQRLRVAHRAAANGHGRCYQSGTGSCSYVRASTRKVPNFNHLACPLARVCSHIRAPVTGVFKFVLSIPEAYPDAAPTLRFVTPVFHPLVSAQGEPRCPLCFAHTAHTARSDLVRAHTRDSKTGNRRSGPHASVSPVGGLPGPDLVCAGPCEETLLSHTSRQPPQLGRCSQVRHTRHTTHTAHVTLFCSVAFALASWVMLTIWCAGTQVSGRGCLRIRAERGQVCGGLAEGRVHKPNGQQPSLLGVEPTL